MREKLIWIAGGVALLLFLCFVWPTRYFYIERGAGAPIVRIDRFTGQAKSVRLR